MQSNSIFSILFVIVVCLVQEAPSEGDLFKINKLNLIWSKAEHSLGQTKMKDLKYDLTRHEIDELALKRMKAHNQDKDGLFEAATRKKLLSILTKYSLERLYDDIHPPVENEHSAKRDNLNQVKSGSVNPTNLKSTFRDKKLDKLWRKAEDSGFTQEQLMILHEEFQNQQDKLDKHYDTMSYLEQEIDRKSGKEMSAGNSLEDESLKVREAPQDKKARLEGNTHQSLKDKYSEIKRNIDKLHKKIVDREIDGPFEESPVNELWIAAQKANFSGEELKSFKEELEHYETRIKKLKHFQIQLERNDIGVKDLSSNTDNRKEDPELRHIRKRVKELNAKVEKSHQTLEKKIADKRDEL